MRHFLRAILLSCFFLLSNVCVGMSVRDLHNGDLEVYGVYGSITVSDELLQRIIRSPEFTRLQGVHQYGAWNYVIGPSSYTRWHHSLGVFYLTVAYGGTYLEQIAALLHDVSHTVFSHAGGWIYHNDYMSADKHQDDIHLWFLSHSGIARLLAEYGISMYDVHHKCGSFFVLEQPLPDICADRLDYNLQGAYLDGMLSSDDIMRILQGLHHENGQWYFDDITLAREFAQLSLFMTRNIWGGPVNGILNYMLGKMLRRGLDIGILTSDDIHFSEDVSVWNILNASDDSEIMRDMFMLRRYQALFFFDDLAYDMWVQAKFRGINPLVNTAETVSRLSTCDPEFARLYDEVKQDVTYGWPIRCLIK